MNILSHARSARAAGLVAATAAGMAAVSPAFGEETTARWYWGWHMWDGGGWFFGPISMLIFWALVITLIVLVVRRITGSNERASASGALEILRERFARGEIDKTEFEERKRVLGA